MRNSSGMLLFPLSEMLARALCVAAFAAGLGSAAQPAAPEVSAHADRSEITVGDRLRYRIEIIAPAGMRAELPSASGNLGTFEARGSHPSPVRDSAGLSLQAWEFDLTSFTVGESSIPSQTVILRGPDGSAEVLKTSPVPVRVLRTAPDTARDIADIAPLVYPPSGIPAWTWLGPLALLLAGGLLWLLLRRRREMPAEVVPELPAYDEARLALDALMREGLDTSGRHREFSFRLSAILRRYITRRYGIDALESTTTEFLEKIRELPLSASQKGALESFCEETDPVKFAGLPLAPGQARSLLDRIGLFLDQTRFQPLQEAPARASTAVSSATPSASGGGAA